MIPVGQLEKLTQARIVTLFQQRLGYDYLGNQIESESRNIEPKLLTAWLVKQGMMQALLTGKIRLLADSSGACHDKAQTMTLETTTEAP